MKRKKVLGIENLHVQLGQRMINEDISLEVYEGEIVGIIGPNGCGKTTFFNAISGFVPIDTGSVLINDQEVNNLSPNRRAALGLNRSFQNVGVFKELTLEENLMMAIENSEKLPWNWMLKSTTRSYVNEKIDEALEDVGLRGHKKSLAGVLSGGQLRLLEMQKLKLAGGDLLLIDEPTAGVSPVLRNELAAQIKGLSKDHGRTIVIIEHDLKFLFSLVDRIIVFVDGKKYIEGTPKEVQADKRLQEVYFG